eukprot:gnl/Dysnectes_brevis/908_a1009_2958.p1 GENE.gnl/Dysnectes_brevis/908_a1009_2958~~gnl/Dysnectes_brevis/908_a1009_2958.p1  ORF type:complete len:288 (+),score=12.35 gnl/Dysnectes_brevis/908_a1009_2958:118-981(+)
MSKQTSVGQKIRRTVLFLLTFTLPLLLNFVSPVLCIFASIYGVLSVSFLFWALMMLSSVFFGRWYCSHLCPWGAYQSTLASMVNIPQSLKRHPRLEIIKFVIGIMWLVALIVFPFVGGMFPKGFKYFFPNSSPDDAFLTTPQNWIWMLIFLSPITLFSYLLGPRAFCRYFCWMGGASSSISFCAKKLGVPSLHVSVDQDNCIGCRKCITSCAMSVALPIRPRGEQSRGSRMVLSSNCIQCRQCVDVCPKGCISSSMGRMCLDTSVSSAKDIEDELSTVEVPEENPGI